MRCESCQKFVGLEMADPEVERCDVDTGTLSVEADVRIVRQCADCGSDMKEATLTLTGEFPEEYGENHKGHWDDLTINGQDDAEPIEEGGGRYKKSYYGAEMTIRLTCAVAKCKNKGQEVEITISDKIAASSMDEMM